jgi:hypothetical protein
MSLDDRSILYPVLPVTLIVLARSYLANFGIDALVSRDVSGRVWFDHSCKCQQGHTFPVEREVLYIYLRVKPRRIVFS